MHSHLLVRFTGGSGSHDCYFSKSEYDMLKIISDSECSGLELILSNISESDNISAEDILYNINRAASVVELRYKTEEYFVTKAETLGVDMISDTFSSGMIGGIQLFNDNLHRYCIDTRSGNCILVKLLLHENGFAEYVSSRDIGDMQFIDTENYKRIHIKKKRRKLGLPSKFKSIKYYLLKHNINDMIQIRRLFSSSKY